MGSNKAINKRLPINQKTFAPLRVALEGLQQLLVQVQHESTLEYFEFVIL